MEFGKTFREIRKRKNIKLKDAAEGIMSQQAVSKFERGDSDITLTNFYYLLDRINVSFEEFMEEAAETTGSMIKTFEEEMDWALAENTHFEWQELLDKYEKKYEETKNEKFLHFSVIVKRYYAISSNGGTNPDDQIVIDYLKSIETWGKYELFLVSLSSFRFDPEEVYLKTKKILKRSINRRACAYQLTDYLLNLVYFFHIRKNVAYEEKVLRLIRDRFEFKKVISNLPFILIYDYVNAISMIRHGDAQGEIICKNILEFMRKCGLKDYANRLYTIFQAE